MDFDVNRIRERFPALKRTHNGKPVVYFDGPGGTQFLDTAIESMCNYMRDGSSNRHGKSPTSPIGQVTEALIAKARDDMKVLLNAHNHDVSFGPNATTLMFHVSRALAKKWSEGDEIILTELDHHANIDTWRSAALDRNVIVKYVPVCAKALTFDFEALKNLITPKTKLIAVGAASNCIGTTVDVKTVSKMAKEVGALLAVDAVHAIPHMYVDVEDLGIDMLFASAYKFFAAHLGMAVIQKDLFGSLDFYKLVPASDDAPDALEIGTQNHEAIASVSAAVQFIAELGQGSSLKEQVISGYKVLEEHEDAIANYIRSEIIKIDGITLYQADENTKKTATIAFRAKGISPHEFCVRMSEDHSIFIASGNFYAKTLAERLGIADSGAFIRLGLAVYSTMEEADRFLEGVRKIMET